MRVKYGYFLHIFSFSVWSSLSTHLPVTVRAKFKYSLIIYVQTFKILMHKSTGTYCNSLIIKKRNFMVILISSINLKLNYMAYGNNFIPKNNLCMCSYCIANISLNYFLKNFPYINIKISHNWNLYHIALIFLPMEIKSLLIKVILKERA